MIDAAVILVGLAIVLGVCVAALPAALVAFAHRSAMQAVRMAIWRSVA